MTLSTYNPDTPCAKCGHTAASTRYCPGSLDPGHLPGCPAEGEHLHRKCVRCQYEWLEATMDQAGPEAS